MSDERTLMQIISDYWDIILFFFAVVAGYVNLKSQSVRNRDDIVELKSRLDKLEGRLDSKLDDVQKDIKEILILIGGKK